MSTAPYADWFQVPQFTGWQSGSDPAQFYQALAQWHQNPLVQKYQKLGWLQDPTIVQQGGADATPSYVLQGNFADPTSGANGMPVMGDPAITAQLAKGGGQWVPSDQVQNFSSSDGNPVLATYNDPNYGPLSYLYESNKEDPLFKLAKYAIMAGAGAVTGAGLLGLGGDAAAAAAPGWVSGYDLPMGSDLLGMTGLGGEMSAVNPYDTALFSGNDAAAGLGGGGDLMSTANPYDAAVMQGSTGVTPGGSIASSGLSGLSLSDILKGAGSLAGVAGQALGAEQGGGRNGGGGIGGLLGGGGGGGARGLNTPVYIPGPTASPLLGNKSGTDYMRGTQPAQQGLNPTLMALLQQLQGGRNGIA